MGSLNNEEDFSWLSSSHGAEGSDDVLKSEFKFSCAEMSPLKSMFENNQDSKENSEFLPINGSKKRLSPDDKKIRSQMDVDGVPAPLSIFSESDMKSGTKDDLVHKEKVSCPFILFDNKSWVGGWGWGTYTLNSFVQWPF